ncbi:MAG TPA: hypothetical protein PKW66_21800, partial [Polyangiaceae bacterium]|nr:hypothetical protein [Polyangiaceae bacterium]
EFPPVSVPDSCLASDDIAASPTAASTFGFVVSPSDSELEEQPHDKIPAPIPQAHSVTHRAQ